MCFKTIKIILFLYSVSWLSYANAIDTSSEEKVCADIGFKRKTQAFGNCVLELLERRDSASANQQYSQQNKNSNDLDDTTCRKYGFKPNTQAYGECRQKIDLARQQGEQEQARYEQQNKQYQEKMAEYQKQVRRAQAQRSLDMGLRMMGGQSPQDAYLSIGTGAPIAPLAPAPSTRTYVLPGGKIMNCTTNGSVTNCF